MAGRIAYYGNTVTNGLVLSLDAAKKDSYPGSGTVWRDISGNGNSGSLVNGPTYSSGNGGSFIFDGVDDYADLGNILFTNITNTTLDIWFNVQTFTGNRAIFTKGAQGAGSDTTWASWIISGTTQIRIRFFNSSNASNFVSTLNLTSNVWYNTVVTYDNSNIVLYNNGSLVETAPLTGLLKNCTHPIRIANDLYGNTCNMTCSGFKIYNRALSASEILQNYNAQKSRYGL